MGSNHCAGLVRTSLERLSGISGIQTNIASHQIIVTFDAGLIDSKALKDTIENAGYDLASIETADSDSHQAAEDAEEKYLGQAWRNLWFTAIPTTIIMLLMIVEMFWRPIPGYLAIVAVLAFPVVFLKGGKATHRSAWRSLKNRTANMDVLISWGSMPPYLIGLIGFFYPMTSFIEMASSIMTFHMLGRYLETRAKGRASQAIKRLIKLGAKTAFVLRDNHEIEIPIKALAIGDVMLVKPGAKVPTDGEIVDGNSHLDESKVY